MKIRKVSVRLAIVGAIIGMSMTVIFSKSPNVLAFIPVASAIGGLIGFVIDKKKRKREDKSSA